MIFVTDKMGKILELHYQETHLEIHNMHPTKPSGMLFQD
jgi:hypothetical protein